MPALKPQEPFNIRTAREIDSLLPVPVYEQAGWLWFALRDENETPLDVLTADQSTYGRLPRLSVQLTPKNWMTPDTCVAIGSLKDEAREAFQTIPASKVFLTHSAGSGDYYAVPETHKGALPVLYAILETDRANIPQEVRHILWPLMWTSVRAGSALVPPNGGGRLVEQKDTTKRAPPDVWHNHRNGTGAPDWKKQIQLPRHDYLVSDAVPTALADDRVIVRGIAIPKGFMKPDDGARRNAFRNACSLMPFSVGLFTNDSWHSSQKNHLDTAVTRHFMRVFTGVETRVLTKLIKDEPAIGTTLRRYLRTEAPSRMHVSCDLT